jgi:hypothetical protein
VKQQKVDWDVSFSTFLQKKENEVYFCAQICQFAQIEYKLYWIKTGHSYVENCRN